MSGAKGEQGEKEVIALIKCPNCAKKLFQLPKNYPLYDVQCSGCFFRAQVKMNQCAPKSEIFGAGWDIMAKVLKSGHAIPPLLAYFKWVSNGKQKRAIYFYPFIPKLHLKKRVLSAQARRANYKMFNYVRMDEVPKFVLYQT